MPEDNKKENLQNVGYFSKAGEEMRVDLGFGGVTKEGMLLGTIREVYGDVHRGLNHVDELSNKQLEMLQYYITKEDWERLTEVYLRLKTWTPSSGSKS